MEVRRVRPGEWRELRSIRLRALGDAPSAFGSTLAREEAQAESVWHQWAEERWEDGDLATFVAVDGEGWWGIAAGFHRHAEPHPKLIAMWTDPARRRQGTGRLLVDAVAGWARDRGATELRLWVTETNEPARALYTGLGFEVTSDRKPLPSDPTLNEVAMRLPLGSPASTGGWALRHLIALGVYLAAAFALYGFRVVPDPSHRLLGGLSSDTDFFVWAIRWWPWAVAHGANPFVSKVVWAPTGYSVAWATSVPLPSLVVAPVTLAFGPVAAFNLLSIVAAPLSAWTAYLLCRRLTSAFLPSLAGGFVFGFSPHLITTLSLGHLDLSLAFLVPVAVYLVVRRLEGSMAPRRFVVLLAVVLFAQFGIFPEIAATLTLMSGLALLLGIAAAPRSRGLLIRAGGWIALSYGIAGLLVSPYLYALVTYPHPSRPLHPASDLAFFAQNWNVTARFMVPGKAQALGGGRLLRGSIQGNGAYFGIPLLAIMGHFFVTRWRRPLTKVLTFTFLAAVLVSLGPAIRVAGHVVPLPWRAVEILPLFRRAIPGRVILYAYLIAAVVLAMWVAERPRWTRWAPAVLAALLLLPATSPAIWSARVDTPAFFTSGQYQRYLSPGETVLVIGNRKGAQMLWQAESNMRFRLVGGYLGGVPPDYAGVGVLRKIPSGGSSPAVLRAFLTAHHVRAVIVFGHEVPLHLDQAARVKPTYLGGILLFRLPAAPAGR